ncbi:MAG: NAD(P)-binding domain-containing protein [Kofleriaceae bacterium]
MNTLVASGVLVSVALFVIAVILRARGKRARIEDTLARQPATPPSLYPRINHDACICSGACIDACPEHDVIAIVDARPRLVRASACVGHSDCLRSCPVSAIELVLGTRERAVEVPVVSGQFESTVPGLFVAGELTGIGLIHNAVEQGKQAARAALAQLDAPAGTTDVDLVVVGAGPAGLGAALEARARGARCVVLEKGELGGAIKSYPRQKIVMSAPFDLPGIGKVKLRRTTKEALLELFADVLRRTQLDIHERAEVTAVRREAEGFAVETRARRWTARRVVLAIGRRGTPRRLGVPGEDRAHVVYHLEDPTRHAGAHVAVIGGGDSAVEAALALAEHARVTLLHRGADFGRCKPDNQSALEAARAEARLTVIPNATVREVAAAQVLLSAPREIPAVPASLVVCCLGAELPSSWLRGLGVGLRALRGEPLW